MSRAFILFIVFCTSLGCTNTTRELDVDAVSAEVVTMLEDYTAAANSGDVDAALDFFADDPRFRWVEDGVLRYRTYAELETAMRSLPGLSVSTIYENRIVTPLSMEHAHVISDFTTTIGDPHAGGFRFSGAGTMTVIRTDDGWKILLGHTSTVRARPGE